MFIDKYINGTFKKQEEKKGYTHEELGYHTTTSSGRPVGHVGRSPEEEYAHKKALIDQKNTRLANVFKMAQLVYGGVNLVSMMKDMGFKNALGKQFLGEDNSVLNVFKGTEQDGWKKLLPDLRNITDKYSINPEAIKQLGTEGLKELFGEDEYNKLIEAGFDFQE